MKQKSMQTTMKCGSHGVFPNSQEFVSRPYKRQRSCSSEEIPEDIAFQILSLLPVKSLFRFTCVCKSWNNLISADSHFHKIHLNQSIKANRLKYVLYQRNRSFQLDYENLVCEKDEIRMKKIADSSLFGPEITDVVPIFCAIELWGSCNGLLCLLTYPRESVMYPYTIALANPSTRETKTIFFGYDTLGYDPLEDDHGIGGGFGYDPVNDDYKVLKIDLSNFSMDLYSLKKNRWDTKWMFPYRHSDFDRYAGKYVNGVIHWSACTRNKPHMVSFDLTKEEFVNISLPPITHSIHYHLETNGKYLYLISLPYNYYELKYEIWVMERNGIKESWKRISFMLGKPRTLSVYYGDWYDRLKLLNFPCGDVDLYYVGGHFLLHNRQDKSLRWVKLKPIGKDYISLNHTAFSYVESLISLGSDRS